MKRTSNILLIFVIALLVVFVLSVNETYGQGIGAVSQGQAAQIVTPPQFNGMPTVNHSTPFVTCWKDGWGLERCTL